MRIVYYINTFIIVTVAALTVYLLVLLVKPQHGVPSAKHEIVPYRPSAVTLDPTVMTNSALALAWSPPSLVLPDLRPILHYYGPVLRPDVAGHDSYHLFSIGSDQELVALKKGEPIFVECQPDPSHVKFAPGACYGVAEYSGSYHLTHRSTPIKLSFRPNLQHKTVSVQMVLTDPAGRVITHPSDHASFELSMEELRAPQSTWEVGDLRVDGSLLMRQKAHWAGQDLFFAYHGGEAYAYTVGKERVDFHEESGLYSCFVGSGDILVWNDHRWQEKERRDGDSQGKTILFIKRVEEKALICELWHPLGIHHINLTLMKSKDPLGIPEIKEHLRFLGAKTWSQFILEADGKRLAVKPRDWLLCTEDGWRVLDTIQQLDDYVEQRLLGALVILDHIRGGHEGQVLSGSLYNVSRTERISIEIPATLRSLPYPSPTCVQTLSLGEVE